MAEAIPDIPICTPPDLPEDTHGTCFLIDKPPSWTSFDVIRRLRGLLGHRKIGHAGTLDPMATGLLICLVGRPATKKMSAFMELPKEYEGVLRLGEITPSYDAEMEVTDRRDWHGVTDEAIRDAFQQHVGTIEQKPPMYSAIKMEGERLYKKARRGEEVETPTRVVEVNSFELTERDGQDVAFRVACSKGTYVRSLAHDVGQALSVGAHLIQLRRIAIGSYRVEDAWRMDQLEQVAA